MRARSSKLAEAYIMSIVVHCVIGRLTNWPNMMWFLLTADYSNKTEVLKTSRRSANSTMCEFKSSLPGSSTWDASLRYKHEVEVVPVPT
jgi:hypothetical protein